MIIDAHHHFWKFDPVEYGWIGEDMRAIRRDFLPEDLAAAIRGAGVHGVVSVQARQSLAETEWLLELARRHDFIKGVVGWVPLVSADVSEALARLVADTKLKAVRHVLQGEPDDYMLRDDFNRGVDLLPALGLAYDILVYERQLPTVIRFVDRHPAQRFVLDHIAKPRIQAGEVEPWRRHLVELARRPNVACKLSGMVTEADFAAWTDEGLTPYFDGALEAFGPRRLMFGSDWPVCEVACAYARWKGIVERFAAKLSADERDRIMGGAAIEIYNLNG
jgi:L-fuconolactonase